MRTVIQIVERDPPVPWPRHGIEACCSVAVKLPVVEKRLPGILLDEGEVGSMRRKGGPKRKYASGYDGSHEARFWGRAWSWS